ncbi:MAG TPA: lipocalin-like domain-containing protein [Candidatus Eremiobacteraceae bacterium]
MNIVLAAAAAAAVTWQPALPGYTFHFPADFGAHESSRDEWWYYTGNLRDARGHRYGFELTFFRVGIQPHLAGGSPWDIDDLYFAHFAAADAASGAYYHVDRTGRAALHAAGATTGDERVWLGKWSARRTAAGKHVLQARADDFALDLTLSPRKPVVLNGRDGVSRKGSCRGCASHYYSFTDLTARGMLSLPSGNVAVTGGAWNDHEWGSAALEPGVVGWDWFSVQLDDGRELMLYLLRRADGSAIPQSSGTLVDGQGRAVYLPLAKFSVAPLGAWTSPHSRARYPAGWLVRLPAYRAELTISPLLADQEFDASHSTGGHYWEGACSVTGSFGGKHVAGQGYTELTGYAPK